MPYATVRGAAINYEIIGSKGPWVSLSPGGRRPIAAYARSESALRKPAIGCCCTTVATAAPPM